MITKLLNEINEKIETLNNLIQDKEYFEKLDERIEKVNNYVQEQKQEIKRLNKGYCELKEKCNNGECDCKNEEYYYMCEHNMKLSLEVDRLNNIINELEKRLIRDKKFFEDVYKKSHLSEEEFRKQCPYTIGSYDHSVETLGKLRELKGSE